MSVEKVKAFFTAQGIKKLNSLEIMILEAENISHPLRVLLIILKEDIRIQTAIGQGRNMKVI